LGVLSRKRPHPRFKRKDGLFWILLRHLWPSWSNVLIIVKPATVVAWLLTPQYDKMIVPGMNIALPKDGKVGDGDMAVCYVFKRLE
jgi:hypothetical protein